MAAWLNHPRYSRIRDELIVRLRSEKYRFRRLDHVIFLCGGKGSSRRENLREYLVKFHKNLSIFYAEAVWTEIIKAKAAASALEIEKYLASLADVVIVIVESPGTFAELGAFSLSNELRQKLLTIMDSVYESNEESFIKTGPIRWVDQDSTFAPTVYTPFSRILEAASAIDERLSRLPESKTAYIRDLGDSPKHLVFFLADLVAVVSPATVQILHYYMMHIVKSDMTEKDVATLVGVAVAMKLVYPHTITDHGVPNTYYLGDPTQTLSKPFHHRRFDLPTLRASHLAVLESIGEANKVIVTINLGAAATK
jgi:hypothetical protein